VLINPVLNKGQHLQTEGNRGGIELSRLDGEIRDGPLGSNLLIDSVLRTIYVLHPVQE
jgi:hypothetical protein